MTFSENQIPGCNEEISKRLSNPENCGNLNINTRVLGDYNIAKKYIKIKNSNAKIDICVDTNNQLVKLNNVCKPDIIDEEIEKEVSLTEIEDGRLVHQGENYSIYNGYVVYRPSKGEKLYTILRDIYGFDNDTEKANKIPTILKLNKNITNADNIQEGKKIIFPIENSRTVIERLDEIKEKKIFQESYDKKTQELLEIEDERKQEISDIQNKQGKVPIIKANLELTGNKLDNNMYSGELNSDAYDIYSNMKNTRGTQVIGQYRNRNGVVEDVILGDNRGKNIYMELDRSYRWDDIDSGRIDNISSQEELEKILVELLKKYEKENRGDI